MARKKSVNVAQVRALIGPHMGNVSAIAKSLGVRRSTVYARITESPELRGLIEDEREKLLDIAESVLANKVMAGDNDMLKFYLRTQGKSRGYSERSEVRAEVVGYSLDEWRRGIANRRQQAESALDLLEDSDDDLLDE